MSEYFLELKSSGKVKVELDFSNYVAKTDLKNATGIDTPSFAKNVDFANLKSNVDKLGIDKLKNVPTNLSNLKSKLDKLDVDKVILVPVDLSKLSDDVKNDGIKKDAYNAKMKNIEDKIPDLTNLATKTTLNASITNLATKTGLTAVENKIPSASNLIKKTDYNTKINHNK